MDRFYRRPSPMHIKHSHLTYMASEVPSHYGHLGPANPAIPEGLSAVQKLEESSNSTRIRTGGTEASF
ncbi:MAG: hypothetical protein DMG56_13865 [Acidobacteria bacterium]|nr:MAG: hypothetical protein DMG53_21040 [Acidobacteriota bacterium]PYU42117.1 MAG: hypothetical protein DMG54_17150 [Acidobacteriota bacterium]PYU57556.1 MAG: hypothetical protein DMG55_19625 [Acidobacteriota bacterium]PYU61257.1 MAG: hypothetical protein DMG56_13865 [Acidobacteriota bacterium]PYU72890.1 MAG: hypothetical protein DMG52_17420 [Acidobacteriota bacterium]